MFKAWTTQTGPLRTAAILAVLMIPSWGCLSEEPLAVDDAPKVEEAVPVLSLGDIRTAVTLDEDQAATLSTALAAWNEGSDGKGRYTGAMTFLATASSVLSPEQLDGVVDVVLEKRSERRRQHKAKGHGKQMGMRKKMRAAKELGITGEQRQALKEIRESSRAQRKSLNEQHKNGALGDAAYDEAMTKLRETTDANLAGVLTEQQQASIKAMKEKRHTKHGERAEKRMDKHVELLTLALALDDGQRTRVANIFADAMEQRAALREEIKNTPSQRKVRHQELRDATQSQLAAALSAEQMQKLNSLERLWPSRGHH